MARSCLCVAPSPTTTIPGVMFRRFDMFRMLPFFSFDLTGWRSAFFWIAEGGCFNKKVLDVVTRLMRR